MEYKESLPALEGVVRYEYAGVVWTHKIQEKQADIYTREYKVLSFLQIFFMALTAVGAVTTAITDLRWLIVTSSVLATISLTVGIIMLAVNFHGLIRKSKKTATRLIDIREDLMALLLEIRRGKSDEETLLSEFTKIKNRLHVVYRKAPNTGRRAERLAEKELIGKAQKKSDKTGDNTYTDEEIDSFLPTELRKYGN